MIATIIIRANAHIKLLAVFEPLSISDILKPPPVCSNLLQNQTTLGNATSVPANEKSGRSCKTAALVFLSKPEGGPARIV